jgi:hypothetical protein
VTNDQKLNLLWLAMAMTVPESTQERFFYDTITEQFFYSRPLRDYPHRLDLFDTIDLHLFDKDYDDIIVRLELLNDENSEIIEIPRLNIADKIAIQLSFLSNLNGAMHLQKLITAVENQKDDFKMVLDTVLIENKNTAHISPYWDDYKLSQVLSYIEVFFRSTGLIFPS